MRKDGTCRRAVPRTFSAPAHMLYRSLGKEETKMFDNGTGTVAWIVLILALIGLFHGYGNGCGGCNDCGSGSGCGSIGGCGCR